MPFASTFNKTVYVDEVDIFLHQIRNLYLLINEELAVGADEQ